MKKLLAILMIGAVLGGILAGCQSSGGEGEATGTPATTSGDSAPPGDTPKGTNETQ